MTLTLASCTAVKGTWCHTFWGVMSILPRDCEEAVYTYNLAYIVLYNFVYDFLNIYSLQFHIQFDFFWNVLTNSCNSCLNYNRFCVWIALQFWTQFLVHCAVYFNFYWIFQKCVDKQLWLVFKQVGTPTVPSAVI
jgi:hypothetical protein